LFLLRNVRQKNDPMKETTMVPGAPQAGRRNFPRPLVSARQN
jgi:hypothetical protein